MKHVWILNHYAPKPDSQGGMRHFSLARHLRAHGWKATIIAADTEIDDGRSRDQLAIEGVSFVWVAARAYHGNGIGRVLNILDYTRAVLKQDMLADIEAPDVVIGSSVHPLAAWAGHRLARRYGVPFVFEVRDLWPQTLIDMGRISTFHPVAIVLRWLEKSLYRSAARIIVLLPGADRYIRPLGIPQERIVWIPNGVDLDKFPANPPRPPSERFTLMYFGAHGEANKLDNVLSAMSLISGEHGRDDIVLRLIGDGSEKAALMSLAAAKKLDNVSFEDPVPKSRVPALAGEADALVFNLADVAVFRYGVSSNKLFDYMASQRPVIFCCSASNNPIADAGAGLTVPPEDPQALAAAILEMASLTPARRAEIGEAGRRYLETNHNMQKLAGRLASTLDKCLDER